MLNADMIYEAADYLDFLRKMATFLYPMISWRATVFPANGL